MTAARYGNPIGGRWGSSCVRRSARCVKPLVNNSEAETKSGGKLRFLQTIVLQTILTCQLSASSRQGKPCGRRYWHGRFPDSACDLPGQLSAVHLAFDSRLAILDMVFQA